MLIDIPVDFSALSTLACARKYQLTCVQGLDTSSKDTNWGSAFHKFMEARNMGCEQQIAELVIPIGTQFQLSPTDMAQLVTTAVSYDNTQPLVVPARDANNQPMVEWKFSFPYLTTDKYRVLLCGTVDIIYVSPNNILVFRDYKTTSKARETDKLEAEYMASFQIPFYLYCLQYHLSQCLSPAVAELATSNRLMGEYQMIYKSFTPPKIKVTAPVRPWPKHEVEALLHPLIGRILAINDLDELAPAEGAATGACKSCHSFFAACLSRDEDTRVNLLSKFKRRVYDPMSFR